MRPDLCLLAVNVNNSMMGRSLAFPAEAKPTASIIMAAGDSCETASKAQRGKDS